MATFDSDKIATTVTRREPSSSGVTAVHADLTVTAAATNDVYRMVKVSKGDVIYDVIVGCGNIDTGTALLITVGDGGDTDRYVTSSSVGQAGGIARMNNYAGQGFTYTEDDTIDILVATGATGVETGSPTISVTVFYGREQ